MESTTEPVEAGPSGVRVVEKRRVRRPVAVAFWVAALVVPLVLTALVGVLRGPALEDSLEADALSALESEGLTGVRLEVDGRQVVAKVPTGSPPAEVKAVVDAVPGVLTVTTEQVFGSAKEARACTGLQGKLDRVTRDQRIPFAPGSARLSGAGATMVRSAATLLKGCRIAEVVVGGHADTTTSNGPTLSLQRARVLIDALRAAGVEARRMEPRGYGDQFPLTEGGSPSARAQNERGSIVVKGA